MVGVTYVDGMRQSKQASIVLINYVGVKVNCGRWDGVTYLDTDWKVAGAASKRGGGCFWRYPIMLQTKEWNGNLSTVSNDVDSSAETLNTQPLYPYFLAKNYKYSSRCNPLLGKQVHAI